MGAMLKDESQGARRALGSGVEELRSILSPDGGGTATDTSTEPDMEAKLTLDVMDRDDWRDWLDTLPSEARARRRDELVVRGLKAGFTLQEMGDEFGFSRERARQIATRQGVVIRELRIEQKAQADRRRRRIARHVYGISLTHPELTVEEIADWADTDAGTVRQGLEHRLAVHETHIRETDSMRTPDEALIAALADWGAQSDSLTGDEYTAWAAERGLPGKQTVAIRFVSWNNALTVAGLGDRIRDRGGVRPVISDQELWASVVEFLRSDLSSYSFARYVSWAQDRALPGGASVRNRLGEWSQIHATARKLLRYAADRDGSWSWAEEILDVIPGAAPRNMVTREECIAALKRVAGLIVGPVTVLAYEAARAVADPHVALIQSRCGSWIHALIEAGLADRLSEARGRLERGEVDFG